MLNSFKSVAALSRWGNSTTQGAHQVAQKLIKRGRPRNCFRYNSVPSLLSISISGKTAVDFCQLFSEYADTGTNGDTSNDAADAVWCNNLLLLVLILG
jgi:hypothetical protein